MPKRRRFVTKGCSWVITANPGNVYHVYYEDVWAVGFKKNITKINAR